MMYLFDTDVLSGLLRRTPSTDLISKLAAVPVERQFTSSINLGELFYGAYGNTERQATLLERLELTILPNVTILPFDVGAARRYGQVRAELERMGSPIGDADTRIAAIALEKGLTVVTGNVRHFGRVPGLVVENWLEE